MMIYTFLSGRYTCIRCMMQPMTLTMILLFIIYNDVNIYNDDADDAIYSDDDDLLMTIMMMTLMMILIRII